MEHLKFILYSAHYYDFKLLSNNGLDVLIKALPKPVTGNPEPTPEPFECLDLFDYIVVNQSKSIVDYLQCYIGVVQPSPPFECIDINDPIFSSFNLNILDYEGCLI